MSIQQWTTPLTGLDSLRQTTAPQPTPGPNEVLVEIHAVSLNYRDIEVTKGEYNHHKSVTQETPATVPCSDMSGVVTQVGPSVSRWRVGDRVLSTFLPDHLTGQVTPQMLARGMGHPLPGVLATHRVFPEQALVKAPAYMQDAEGATLPIASVTAWMSVQGRLRAAVEKGEDVSRKVVLVQGTGGVAVAGLQIAKAWGARVIVTSSSDAKLEQAKALGADFTINYRTTPDWEEEVNRFTEGNGVDIILETGGAKTLRKSFECIAFGGLINCIGYVSGKMDEPEDRVNVNLLTLRRNVTLQGIINGPRDEFERMVEFYEQHQIRPVVNRVFGFAQAREAFEFVESGAHFGKVVIDVVGASQ
ncbi:putative alcohol dehydrogenase [Aspergillus japonicus CBS 114.51]|uniref:Putative alcohol dehydrogenase n=2 Tax=Aspergillus TaxID=5052 RepID=A0A2V5GPV7_ASPV1|nr:putative alcohol dehydrogenase [Aspergillus japonicus CBS 114.51]PYI13079.1 putative alcohol dehydrogenase [Aspergillus violaceofuscus CBS 115571]RAH86086.1 putative alcohol dehydrogenase [Aspergillus japonicus CBS 114.51]